MLPTPPASPRLSAFCEPEDRIGQVLAGQIQLTGILGVGAYGTVYAARDVTNNVEYAVKCLNKVGLDPRQLEFQEREIQLHYQASNHHNVVSMVKILDSPDCTFVVLEYCPEGDLFAKITEEGHYVGDDYKAKCAFLQILEAVRHCHELSIFHRDLKPENILVKDDGWTIKLADFGLASRDAITSDFGCGSTFYMSPECQQANPSSFACYAAAPNDIWSLGVVLVNLTCGRNGWKRASIEDPTFKAFMKDRNYLRTILPISDELNFIFQRVFELDPRRRASLDELYDLVLRCPRFTQGLSASRIPTPPYSPVASVLDLPLTPPYSPVESVADALIEPAIDISDVPFMSLPGQQFPAIAGACPEGHATISTALFTPPDANLCGIFTASSYVGQPHGGLPTPPGSNQPSPKLVPQAYPDKRVESTAVPYPSQATFFPSTQMWPRYGQFLSNYVPRSSHLWTCVPTY